MKAFSEYKLRGILIISTFLLPNTLCAQSVITGKILNALDKPIADVVISSKDNHPVISAKDGRFRVGCPVDSVSILLEFSCVGYKSRSMKLYAGEENVKVVLQDSITYLNEITVRSHKYSKFSNYAAPVTRLNTLDILTSPSALGDIIGGVSGMPGVQRNENDGRLVIQGGATDESQIVVDGLVMSNPYTLSQKNSSVRSRFSPDLFSGISLQSAGYGAEFGNALSGLLQLNTHSLQEMNDQTDFSISSVGLSSSLIRRNNHNAFRGELSYSDLNPYGKVVKDDYEWKNRYRNLSGDAFWIHLTPKGDEIKTHAYFSQSGVHYLYNNTDKITFDNDFSERNAFVSSVGNFSLSDTWKLFTGISFGYNRFSGTDVSYQSDKVRNVKMDSQAKVEAVYQYGIFSNKVGVEDQFASFDEKYTLNETNKMKYTNHQLAGFDELSLLINRLNINLGLRGEYSTYLKEYAFSPRLYSSYKFNANNILSLSLGKYVQLPTSDYLKFTKTIDFRESLGSTLTYSYVKNSSKLQFDLYYKQYEKLITYTYSDLHYTKIANQGEGYAKGFNLFWKNNIGALEYWFSYSYLHANLISGNYPVRRMPGYLSANTFNLTTKYWVKSLRTMLGSSIFIDSGASFYNEHNASSSSIQSPNRSRWDLSLSYLPVNGVIVHFCCQNVLGRKNIYGYEYSTLQDNMCPIRQPDKQFFYIGLFITLSHSHKNQLKSL